MRTAFAFRSLVFNISEPRDYFINPACFGDDTAKWLAKRLRDNGVSTEPDPTQEDFGWYFQFTVNNKKYRLIIGFQPNDTSTGDRWIGEIERTTGLLGTLLGRRHGDIDEAAVNVVNEVLNASPEVNELKWYERESIWDN